MKFQLESLSTIMVLKTKNDEIIKISKDIPDNFFNMSLLLDDTYYNPYDNTYWYKKTSIISTDKVELYQEEYINVTKFLEENIKLNQLLKEDPLTKIANIKAVTEMKNEIEINKKSCIMVMCDINDFKLINDTYGHSIGDKTLIEISKLFVDNIRNQQDLVARIGGDEFFFLFKTDNVISIVNKMNDLQEKVNQLGNEYGFSLSISVGMASYKYGDDWELKRKEADNALYYVKNSLNKNQLAYWDLEKGKPIIYLSSSFQKKLV